MSCDLRKDNYLDRECFPEAEKRYKQWIEHLQNMPLRRLTVKRLRALNSILDRFETQNNITPTLLENLETYIRKAGLNY